MTPTESEGKRLEGKRGDIIAAVEEFAQKLADGSMSNEFNEDLLSIFVLNVVPGAREMYNRALTAYYNKRGK